jgi:primosomal protein N' (replication factor Y)
MVGARSAIMLPCPDLGIIIVDEEHDTSYKQEENGIYNARDMAVARGRFENIPVVLASATPSLETVANVQEGRYTALRLANRYAGAELPDVNLIDLKTDPPPRGRWLSPRLTEEIRATLDRNEQVLLFLNRRGYAPLTLCRTCGHRIECPHCTAFMVEHREKKKLLCHQCGHTVPLPDRCPDCQSENSFAAVGPGVERIAEETGVLFPEARTALFTSDIAPGVLRRHVEDLESGKTQIVIGTQLIAKGHHFPNLTLVGVVDADLGLTGGDLRAAERTAQILQQVAGRAGRESRPGTALIQTAFPDHPLMRALEGRNRAAFVERELLDRKTAGMPPYGRLAAIILSGVKENQVEALAVQLAKKIPRHPDITVWGPAIPPLARVRGRHRRRFLIKAAKTARLQDFIARWTAQVPVPSSIRLTVDIDPYGFM